MPDADDADGMTDAERERAVLALRDRYATGALSLDEFARRLDRLLRATTREELRGLAADAGASSVSSAVAWHDTRPGDVEVIGRNLLPDEELLWIGRPDPRKQLAPGDRFLIPFSLLWAGFAVFWESQALRTGSVFFPLWGAAFVLVGVYFVFGRFVYKASRKRRTLYAVTSRRVLSIVRQRSGETVDATYLGTIPNLSTNVSANGRGRILFGNAAPFATQYLNSGMDFFARGYASGGVSFFDIPDARAVAELVERLRENQPPGPAPPSRSRTSRP